MLVRGLIVAMAAVTGAAMGWGISGQGWLTLPAEPIAVPQPYRVPKLAGGSALSLAMLHDVLHEHYLRHGTAYYQERNRRIQKSLAQPNTSPADATQGSLKRLELLNDLAVGQYSAGEFAAALETLKQKRALQVDVERKWREDPARTPATIDSLSRGPLSPEQMELYRTYANLGTFLILDSLREGVADNPTSQKRLVEGTDIIREAISLYPESHFGREKWQLVILEFVQGVAKRPQLLLEYDMVGNRLEGQLPSDPQGYQPGWPEAWQEDLGPRGTWDKLVGNSRDATYEKTRGDLRKRYITHVGADPGWTEAVASVHKHPVPFDEPALAIAGMWMIGGGPNPFFAVALGGTLERTGELVLAWDAYQRAEEMGGGIWPDARIQDGFIAHCRRCRERIEKALAEDYKKPESRWRQFAARLPAVDLSEVPGDTPASWSRWLQREHTSQLQQGRDRQKDYHDFEKTRIAEGIAPDNPEFYKPFEQKHPRLSASADKFDFITFVPAIGFAQRWPAVLFCAGLAAVSAGIWLRCSKRFS